MRLVVVSRWARPGLAWAMRGGPIAPGLTPHLHMDLLPPPCLANSFPPAQCLLPAPLSVARPLAPPCPRRHSLDELEALVREKFAGVKDGGIAPPSFPPDAVTAVQGGLLLRMVPERDGHSIELQWPTVSEHQHYRQAPSHYASHLLGHEGEGSAFALLKARGWATGLVAGEAGTSYRWAPIVEGAR